MNKKILKPIYCIDLIIFLLSYLYFSLLGIRDILSYTYYGTTSALLAGVYEFLDNFTKMGINYEGAAFIPMFLVAILLLVGIFSAIFYRKYVSKATYIMLVCSVLPTVLYYFKRGFENRRATLVLDIIWFVMVLAYAIATTIFMCKDLKRFDAQ